MVEVMIASFIAALVMYSVYLMFNSFRSGGANAHAQMNMEESTFAALSRLQRDLTETNLQSIRSNATNLPCLAFESARDDGDKLTMTAFGIVKWTKFVFYQMEAMPGTNPPRGQLTYDDTITGVVAEPSAPPSFPLAAGLHHRVLGQNFVLGPPGSHTVTLKMNAVRGPMSEDVVAGFYPYWLDSTNTKHDFGDGATDRGEPVHVDMALIDYSPNTGQPTVRVLSIEVKPQN
jgi:hypothetical protein